MNCNEMLPLICGYLDGENTESENGTLQEHLATCPRCREILAEMQMNDRLLSAVPEAPADLTWRIMQQVRKEPKKRRNWKRWGATLSAAAVLTVVLLSGTFLPDGTRSAETGATATENEALRRIATEVCMEAEAMTEGSPTMAMQSTDAAMTPESCSLAAYLSTAEIPELNELEPMDLSEARTLLTADAAARLDLLASRQLQAYLVSADVMQKLQVNYAMELLTTNAEAENYMIFLSAADASTP